MTYDVSSISQPVEGAALKTLSLGAGIQSSTLLLMAECGAIGPKPDAAIFADTGFEPAATYAWLSQLETLTSIPVIRVATGNLKDDLLDVTDPSKPKRRFASVPVFTEGGGMARRQCTREYKIDAVTKAIRQLLGIVPKKRVPRGTTAEVWIGISTDEIVRLKDSRIAWQINRWPLIEQGMRRSDCISWLKAHGYPAPPKSSCIGCPYRSNASWRSMKTQAPEDFAQAVAIDTALRSGRGLPGLKEAAYLHSDRIPLAEVDFDKDSNQLGLLDECDGVCGT
ncbi:MAG: hypothetical protein AAF066_02200 [Pseudomonadota bacterium]